MSLILLKLLRIRGSSSLPKEPGTSVSKMVYVCSKDHVYPILHVPIQGKLRRRDFMANT